jgi:hypothetical protein
MPTFFGLTSKYRTNLFRQIHEIIFHGNGGYDWDTVYNMPIWLRNLTFNLINEHYKKQNQETSAEDSWLKGNARNAAQERKKITPPSYVTKASKK